MSRIIYLNILGGPPYEYVIEKLNTFGEVYIVQPEFIEDPVLLKLQSLVNDVQLLYKDSPEENLSEFLVSYARKIEADLIITFDEFHLHDVAKANLMLGLPGIGKNAKRSINKTEMYKNLKQHDLLKRNYYCFSSEQELLDSLSVIKSPAVIKPSACAGSLGVFLITKDMEAEKITEMYKRANASIEEVEKNMPYRGSKNNNLFLHENLLEGSAEDWFGTGTAYADYISVEGVIIQSKYYPIAITQNYPLVYPFIETVSLSPTTLPIEVQCQIIERIKPCMEAFNLDYCGTHTEIKLLKNKEFAIIETAARFAGWKIIQQVESVFRIDPISGLIQELLGEPYPWKRIDELYQNQNGCAATINLLPVDEFGAPWPRTQYKSIPDFSDIIDTSSKYTLYEGHDEAISVGKYIEPLSIFNGSWNSFGQVFLQSKNIDILNSDIYNIKKNLRNKISGV